MDEDLLKKFTESSDTKDDDTSSLGSADTADDTLGSLSSSLSFEALSETSVEKDLNLDVVSSISEDTGNDIDGLQTSGYVKVEESQTSNDQSSESSSDDVESSSAEDEVSSINEQIDTFMKVIDSQMVPTSIAEPNHSGESFPNENGAGDTENASMTIRAAPSGAISAGGAGLTRNNSSKVKVSTVPKVENVDSDAGDDDIEDETLSERLWGLTEMFPDRLRSSSKLLFDFSCNSTKFFYVWGRKTLWVVATSVIVLYLPVALEVERLQMEKDSLGQAQDILLGPQSKSKDSSAPPMPTIPQ